MKQQLAVILFSAAAAVCAADLRWAAYVPELDNISGIAVDNDDTVYVVGRQRSPRPGTSDIVIRRTRVLAGMSNAQWSVTVGGPGDDIGGRVAIDNSGNIFVTGTTQSGALTGVATGDATSCPCSFLTRVNAASGRIIWTKLWPGTGIALALGPDGGIYVAHESGHDAFIRKLNSDGSLVWQKQFGGSKTDTPTDLALTSAGEIVVTGSTDSPDFPTTQGAYQRTLQSLAESPDQFITKFSADASHMVWSTYFGYQRQTGARVGLDSAGNVYVTAYARDSFIPTNRTLPFSLRELLAKFTAEGALSWVAPIGDGNLRSSMAVTPAGDVWLAGLGAGQGAIATPDALQDRPYSGGDALLLRINTTGERITYGTFLGGTDTDWAGPITLDAAGNCIFAGYTQSEDFPITRAQELTLGLSFVAKLDLKLKPSVRVQSAVDAASYIGGPLVPGKVVTLFGYGLGPVSGVSASVAAGKLPVTIAGTTVKVNGTAAPLLYASDRQVNAIVPFSITGLANINLCSSAGCSNNISLAMTDIDISVFSQNGNGAGPAAALNEDNILNSAANPARVGTVLQIWATGAGPTSPVVEDGSINTTLTSLANPIGAYIGGAPAEILYAGAAPGLPAGVIQINVRVPEGSPKGETWLSIGRPSGYTGPLKQGVTVFVR